MKYIIATIVLLAVIQMVLFTMVRQQRQQIDAVANAQLDLHRLTSELLKSQGIFSESSGIRHKAEIEVLSTRIETLEKELKASKLESEIRERQLKIESLEKELLKK